MLNSTPRSERITIGFFGRRNAGKSSLLNAVTGQEIAVVSDVLGTTTDPVLKSMELLPLGPVTVIDTPGFDDEGTLGEKRIEKTKEILDKTDIAVLVCDSTIGIGEVEKNLINLFKEREIPHITAYNKAELLAERKALKEDEIYVSANTKENINELKDKIGSLAPEAKKLHLVSDFIEKGDTVVLVCPIDASAPKGRIILPQQQAIRDILDKSAMAVVVQPEELSACLDNLKTPPALVICDSQVFKKVDEIVPEEIPLTSFSILFARYKGLLGAALEGAKSLDELADGDRVLISEGCSHHRQCGDIGTEKLPKWILGYTKKEINFEFSSGGTFPEDLEKYALIIHCGGCMLGDREILSRQKKAGAKKVPITNYGLVIAKMNGILDRSTKIIK